MDAHGPGALGRGQELSMARVAPRGAEGRTQPSRPSALPELCCRDDVEGDLPGDPGREGAREDADHCGRDLDGEALDEPERAVIGPGVEIRLGGEIPGRHRLRKRLPPALEPRSLEPRSEPEPSSRRHQRVGVREQARCEAKGGIGIGSKDPRERLSVPFALGSRRAQCDDRPRAEWRDHVVSVTRFGVEQLGVAAQCSDPLDSLHRTSLPP